MGKTKRVPSGKKNKAVFKYVEFELYNHEQNKKELDEVLNDMLGEKPEPGQRMPQGTTSDPTGRVVTKFLTSRRVTRMDINIQAIERSLKKLNDEHRQLYFLKYVQMLPWQDIINELPTSERTYFRLRRELVMTVAQELGIIDVGEWQ